ncbi:MAG: hypothetical protein HGA19_15565 [Oscillochloris sp.]|nr:hypothetical protein [Oscillochloris sp.]
MRHAGCGHERDLPLTRTIPELRAQAADLLVWSETPATGGTYQPRLAQLLSVPDTTTLINEDLRQHTEQVDRELSIYVD